MENPVITDDGDILKKQIKSEYMWKDEPISFVYKNVVVTDDGDVLKTTPQS